LILPGTAVGSILAAAIAGLVVFISTVLTKEQKTSEFRQVWIDEIRKDVSQFIAGVSEVVALYVAKKGDVASQEKFIDDNFKLLHELQMVEHRIILRLNPTKHAKLIEKVTGFRSSMLAAYKTPNRKKIEDDLTYDLLSTTKTVLAFEWERVKSGEPIFRRVKYGALALLTFLGVFLLYLLFIPEPPSEKAAEIPEKNTTQIFQYFAAPEPVKPTRRILQKVQNNLIFIELPSRDDCPHAASQCTP
jgi:hypothetical protein